MAFNRRFFDSRTIVSAVILVADDSSGDGDVECSDNGGDEHDKSMVIFFRCGYRVTRETISGENENADETSEDSAMVAHADADADADLDVGAEVRCKCGACQLPKLLA